jgi:peptide/nickel transport system permease protein
VIGHRPGAPRRLLPGTAAGLGLLGLMIALALAADIVAPGDPFASSDAVLEPPSWRRPFGSDDLGRDQFRAVVHGARPALLVAFGASITALLIGGLVGSAAGYAGGLVDEILMRVTEMFQVMPRFFLVLAAVAVFGSGFWLLVLLLGFTSWTGLARLVRAQVLALLSIDHVLAARAQGAGDLRVLSTHVLPLAAAPILAQLSFVASGTILLEAGVSFLGLGDPAVMTWGMLLHEAHHFLRHAWWMSVFPGLILTLTVLSFHLLGDAAAEAAAPR